MKKDLKYITAYVVFIFYSLGIVGILYIKGTANTAVYTNSTAVTSHVIVIDAGHGLPDEGAIGIYGTTEEAINLKIAFKLQALIEQSGGIVYLTRSDAYGIYTPDKTTIREKKVSDSKNRVIIGNQEDVELFVSIHLNKYSSSAYSGWQTFYQDGNESSKKLASCIQNGLNETISTTNNRKPLVLKGTYIMEHIENPAVTVECGFLSNEVEAKKLEEDEYQEKLAWGIYIGIQNFFNEK